MLRPFISLAALALVATAGCHVDLNDPGTDPLAADLYFPAGLKMDPAQQFLYVSNGNSDLRYGGGTVEMIDLLRFHCALNAFAGRPTDAPTDCPTAAADVAGCVPDVLDPSVANCGTIPLDDPIPAHHILPYVLANQTVKVGNFAGNMLLQTTGDTTRRLFVGVRGDPSVTEVDVDLSAHPPGGHALSCFDNPLSVPIKPNGPFVPPVCDPDFLIQEYNCVMHPNCKVGPDSANPSTAPIPPEPFGLAIDQGLRADQTPYNRLVISHLSGGQVSLVELGTGQPNNVVQYVSSPFFQEDNLHRHGAFALAPQQPGNASSLWYMTSNLQPTISVFRIADVNLVIPQLEFTISGTFATGFDLRAIAFDDSGNRAFVTENDPPSVVVIDTHFQPGPTNGNPANQVVDVINVCQSPSHLATRTVAIAGAPGAPPRTRTQIWVVCFLSNQVMVVDPDAAEVTDIIQVGRGPNDIAFADDPRFRPQHRAYVSNFSDSTLSVLDLDPGSPTQNRMIARIGLPVAPPIQ